jgi:hypothetical protein
MHFMYEQLVNDHIRQLHDDAAAARLKQQARRAGQPTHIGRILRRIGQRTRRPTLARPSPVHTLDTTTSTS